VKTRVKLSSAFASLELVSEDESDYQSDMANFQMSVQHKLTQEEAMNRIKNLLSEVKNQYAGSIDKLHEEWNGNSNTFNFTAMGFSVSGVLTVLPSEITLACDLPFAASLFKGKIESAIRDKAETLLA
jgi:hypothetical protein